MRIAIIGAQGTGKTTYVEKFLEKWPMYKRPEHTYRDLVRSKGLSLNREGDQLSQQAIMDALVEQATSASDEKYVIHDRCILDNLAHTMYLAELEPSPISEDFLEQSMLIAGQVVKLYDIIFYLPTAGFDISNAENLEREQRDTDQTYRQSIDNILQMFHLVNLERKGVLFDREDSPPIIPLGGHVVEKLVLTNLYVDDNGDPYETGFNLTEEIDKMPRIITP